MRQNAGERGHFMMALVRNGPTLFLAIALAHLTLGNNEIYRLGASFGESLRSADGDGEAMDLKDLAYELEQLEEQFGTTSEVGKLFESESFTDGATFGYYKREILGQ
jgi:hypothetical protein